MGIHAVYALRNENDVATSVIDWSIVNYFE